MEVFMETSEKSQNSANKSLIFAMQKCNQMVEKVGVSVRGNKKYMMVKDRVQLFRETFGLEFTIDSNLLFQDSNRVICETKIKDLNNNVIASGIAEELRATNKSSVNFTSAIENCQTSSIGRALASFGLMGTEYASADELQAVTRKEKILEAPVNSKTDDIPFTENDLETKWDEYCANFEIEINKTSNQQSLRELQQRNKSNIEKLKKEEPTLYAELSTAFKQRMNILMQNAEDSE